MWSFFLIGNKNNINQDEEKYRMKIQGVHDGEHKKKQQTTTKKIELKVFFVTLDTSIICIKCHYIYIYIYILEQKLLPDSLCFTFSSLSDSVCLDRKIWRRI